MLRKKKGFTLVELLAVIVILAIILAIAVPDITNMVANARRDAFQSNVKLIIRGIEYKMLEDLTSVDVDVDALDELTSFGADPTQYQSFAISDLDPVTVDVVAAQGGKFDGWQATAATYTSVSATAVTYP
jgi:prepilin-type N-terminal cleavage/methylation domain-containing protein